MDNLLIYWENLLYARERILLQMEKIAVSRYVKQEGNEWPNTRDD